MSPEHQDGSQEDNVFYLPGAHAGMSHENGSGAQLYALSQDLLDELALDETAARELPLRGWSAIIQYDLSGYFRVPFEQDAFGLIREQLAHRHPGVCSNDEFVMISYFVEDDTEQVRATAARAATEFAALLSLPEDCPAEVKLSYLSWGGKQAEPDIDEGLLDSLHQGGLFYAHDPGYVIDYEKPEKLYGVTMKIARSEGGRLGIHPGAPQLVVNQLIRHAGMALSGLNEAKILFTVGETSSQTHRAIRTLAAWVTELWQLEPSAVSYTVEPRAGEPDAPGRHLRPVE